MEEERRLAYVGITRAKENLVLTRARSRTLYGRMMMNPPSRFLSELPEELVSEVGKSEPTINHLKPLMKPRRLHQPTVSPDAWRVGDKVQHRKFGRGTVVKVSGTGDDVELDIAFPAPTGVRRFMAGLAPIEKV